MGTCPAGERMLGLHQTEESALAAQSQLAIAGLHETQESQLAAQSQIAAPADWASPAPATC